MKLHKILLLVLIASILILGPLFIANETFDFSKKINHDKFAAFFTIIAAIVTAGSFYIIAMQAKLMREANESEVMPRIFIESIKLKIIEDDNSHWNQPNNIRLGALLESSDPFEGRQIEIKNLGNGTAYNLRSEWIYDCEKVNDIINGLYRPVLVDVDSEKEERDYIEPGQIMHMINEPFTYVCLFGKKLYTNTTRKFEKNGIPFTPPTIELHLDFQNIHSTNYKSTFAVSIFFYAGTELWFRFSLISQDKI